MSRFLRYLWAGPTTLIGIVLAFPSLHRGHVAIVDGVIEAHSPFLSWGPFFVPAYLLAGVWALLQGGHPYFDNRFEREARCYPIG
jgi:hypothetical protein